jgi:hypothetical protein
MDFNPFYTGSSDFSVDTLSPLFGKEGPGEILRITNTPIFFQEHHLRLLL